MLANEDAVWARCTRTWGAWLGTKVFGADVVGMRVLGVEQIKWGLYSHLQDIQLNRSALFAQTSLGATRNHRGAYIDPNVGPRN
jgi:hypothetical protein